MSRNPYQSPSETPLSETPPAETPQRREKWWCKKRNRWWEHSIWIPLLLIALLLVSFALSAARVALP